MATCPAGARAEAARPRRRAACRGLTLLELMLGLAVGLFVAAAALGALVRLLHDDRRLLRQLQLQQQLAGVAALVARDLRRAGHWADAAQGLARDGAPGRTNPYAALADAMPGEAGSRLRFAWAAAPAALPGAGVLPAEQAGFRLRQGIVDMQLGEGHWQPLTDPARMTVTTFELTLRQQVQDLEPQCAKPRPQGSCAEGALCPPRLLRRSVGLQLEARSPQDPALRHALRTEVALRNDAVEGECPG